MEVDKNLSADVDTLIKSYPSLQRLPDKDRVREIFFDILKRQNLFFYRLNAIGLNMKYQLVLMLLKNIFREKNIKHY